MVHQSVAILVHYYSRICISWISPPSAITSFTWKLFLEGSWLWRVYNDNIAGYRLFPLHMWPHGSSLKAEAPLGRLWSRAQTVAHSAAVASRPALPRCRPDWSLSAVEYKVTTITTQLAQKWWEYYKNVFLLLIFLPASLVFLDVSLIQIYFCSILWSWVFNASRAEEWKDFCSALQKLSQSKETRNLYCWAVINLFFAMRLCIWRWRQCSGSGR